MSTELEQVEELRRKLLYDVMEISLPTSNQYSPDNLSRPANRPGQPIIAFAPPQSTKDTTPSAIIEDTTMLKVLEFRASGKQVHQIATDLNLKINTVHKLLRLAMDVIAQGSQDAAEQIRTLETVRLDTMLSAIYPRATDPFDPDYAAIDRVLKIMERRAKMYGVDNLIMAESADGQTPNIHITNVISSDERTIELSHELLSRVARLSSGAGVDLDERQIPDTTPHLASLFDLDEGGSGDQSASAGGDAPTSRQD